MNKIKFTHDGVDHFVEYELGTEEWGDLNFEVSEKVRGMIIREAREFIDTPLDFSCPICGGRDC